jgi:hypothetical protein
MAKRALALFSVFVFSLGLCVIGAQQPAAQEPKPDRIEDAHQGLLAPKPATSAEAVRTTNEVAKGLPEGSQARTRIPRKNFIDEFIFDRIERDNIPHAALSSDEEFVRRAYLDVMGMLPTVQQVRDFVANKDAAKRDKLIDSLIGTEEFTEQFAWFWGDLFRLGADTGYGKNAFNSGSRNGCAWTARTTKWSTIC